MNAFTIIGQVVVGLFALAVILTMLEIAKDLLGYICGAYRLKRLDALRDGITHRQILRYAVRNWWQGGGWFITLEGKRVYLNGWRPIEDDD